MIYHRVLARGFGALVTVMALALGGLSANAASPLGVQPGQLALVVPPEQVPPALQQAITDQRASVGASASYAGDCATVKLPEDLIKQCSEVLSIEGDTAIVNIARVTGEGYDPPVRHVYKQVGETWVYSGYVVVSAPAPPATGTGDGGGVNGAIEWPLVVGGLALVALAGAEAWLIFRPRPTRSSAAASR